MSANIDHEKDDQQFTIKLGDDDAELAYTLPEEGIICFTHTYVPEPERGKGLAAKLIEKGIAYAREQNYKVQAQCPAVAKYLKAHPEHDDIKV
ncbi:GNAT family N-acetyltransferase [uncultured Pontibacter sp.]|uniref:GNAT family N-acetyltransferase n=1 Tax=uncultured Pontibacter sp. TaxID=453356 RepID=UPI00260C65F8|nr:GNAT family N-acetyltransferase [uncultured Pontibacter sp.]